MPSSKMRSGWTPTLQPEVVGFVVARHAVLALEDGDVELFGRHVEPLGRGNQLPGVGNGVLLEIVAKAEVAEHLEKGMMAIGKAHIFKIVVLAAGADALLRGGGARVVALFGAEKDVLELVHARVGKQQGGVVGGNQRGAMHLAVALLDEKVQEHAANVISGRHTSHFR